MQQAWGVIIYYLLEPALWALGLILVVGAVVVWLVSNRE